MEKKKVLITYATYGSGHKTVANYIYELTTLFHSYYANEKIVSDDEIYTKQRINLIAAIKIVINNSLNLIGVIPREEM